MQMVQAAGMPVPTVLNCGEHPNAPCNRKFSILMTRLHGVPLENSDAPLSVADEEPWLEELKMCMQSMRSWNPPNQDVVSSPIATGLRSSRVPGHIMDPFLNQKTFYDFLIAPALSHGFKTPGEYEEALARARRPRDCDYRILFTRGDFKAHNIFVDDDRHLSGFLDWSSAGWYPEYWGYNSDAFW